MIDGFAVGLVSGLAVMAGLELVRTWQRSKHEQAWRDAWADYQPKKRKGKRRK